MKAIETKTQKRFSNEVSAQNYAILLYCMNSISEKDFILHFVDSEKDAEKIIQDNVAFDYIVSSMFYLTTKIRKAVTDKASLTDVDSLVNDCNFDISLFVNDYIDL